MNSELVKPTNGTISFDIIGPYKPGNSRTLFIQAIMTAIAGKPIPIPDPAKFTFEEFPCMHDEYEGAKLEISWRRNSDLLFSGKIHQDILILATFSHT